MSDFDRAIAAINAVLFHDYVLLALLATGVVFTLWSGFCQYHSLTHGIAVTRGDFDNPDDPGAISHFQALSAALSGTMGLGNIGGVAIAISLGGPGAIFWMWVTGLIGMALKTTEVTLAMLYRNTDEPENPHGGTMWVISRALARRSPALGRVGHAIGVLFCMTLLVMVIAGGNMFQSWNVAEITESYFAIPGAVSGVIMAVIVGLVIIGGIKRIGAVAAQLVPWMTLIYLAGAAWVLVPRYADIPALLALIVSAAFSPAEASGAFIGGSAGYAFLYGMKRALFSNEAGQGTAPIAHAAAKTREPVREAVVAGLEPFLDTIVVCTLTALVIVATGTYKRAPDGWGQFTEFEKLSELSPAAWQLPPQPAPARNGESWREGDDVFVIASAHANPQSGNDLHRIAGTLVRATDGHLEIHWQPFSSTVRPTLAGPGIYSDFVGSTLTAKAFDSVQPGLGKWLVTISAWLFAIATMIAYSYYGEQGVIYVAGERWVTPFKIVYLALAIVATLGFLKTDTQLDNLSGLGTGLMLWVNVPVLWLLGGEAMRAYRDYIRRHRAGQMSPAGAGPRKPR